MKGSIKDIISEINKNVPKTILNYDDAKLWLMGVYKNYLLNTESSNAKSSEYVTGNIFGYEYQITFKKEFIPPTLILHYKYSRTAKRAGRDPEETKELLDESNYIKRLVKEIQLFYENKGSGDKFREAVMNAEYNSKYPLSVQIEIGRSIVLEMLSTARFQAVREYIGKKK